MDNFKIVEGDIFELIDQQSFDVVLHGCNCFNNMGGGIAVPMKLKFGCDKFQLERPVYFGDYNKLGQIDYETRYFNGKDWLKESNEFSQHRMVVVNAYSQYHYGFKFGPPVDYDALTLCLRKINNVFKYKRVGLPAIGSGLAGGDYDRILDTMKRELKNCDVTLVILKK